MIRNREVLLSEIHPPTLQPRLDAEDPGIAELAANIERHGLFTPLVVTPIEGGYRLIAGNRRLKALQRLGRKSAPCRIMVVEPAEADEITIAENLIRRNLSPVEEAYAFGMYLQSTGETQEQLADALGKERTYVTRRLLLLDLDDMTLGALEENLITLSQALLLRQLDTIETRERFIEHAQKYGANTRVMQTWVANYKKEQARVRAAEDRDLEPQEYQPPREVMMACDRCGTPTNYNSLRPAYFCPKCIQATAAYRAAKEGEV